MSNEQVSPAEPPSLQNDMSNKEVLRSAFAPTPLKKPKAPRSHTPSASVSAQSGIKRYMGTHASNTPPSRPLPPAVEECQPDALQKTPYKWPDHSNRKVSFPTDFRNLAVSLQMCKEERYKCVAKIAFHT